VAWVRGFGRGRVFYTSFGHDERAWLNGPTLKHILGGIQYALRDVSTDETPSEPQFVKSPFAASAASDIWPFLRKPGKGLAEPGPLGIAATRDGRLLTMRILRTRK
jgi:hypothetical protein